MLNNTQRAKIMEYSQISPGVRKSLQPCSIQDNKSVIENKMSKISDLSRVRNLSALLYILDCLQAKISLDGIYGGVGYMRFQEALDIYKSFFTPNETRCTDEKELKSELRNLVCHMEYGLCVYIVQIPRIDEVIVLRPDGIDLSHWLRFLISSQLDAEEADKKKDKMIISRKFCQDLMSCMETEWDKRVMRVMISAGRTNKEYEALGFKSEMRKSDLNRIDNYLQLVDGLEAEAKAAVANQLTSKKEKLEEKIKKKKRLLLEKKFRWTAAQVAEHEEELEMLQERHSSTDSLAQQINEDIVENPALLKRITRKKTQLVAAKRLLKRKLGSGRKRQIDEEDEYFLEKCIAEKATAHGRRQDSVWYLNHRVKGSHLLKLLNQHHMKRGLPLLKSFSAVYNRSRPKNKRSKQAKNHIGLALFCCKKSPKSEEISSILTHYCRSSKKVTSSSLCNADSDLVLFRSFDDKAYLCPGTRTGMDSTRSQKVLTTVDESKARKFKKYDFPISMLSCTPGVFLYMNKSLQKDSDGNEVLAVDQQDVVVAVKSKYFVGSSGSVWGSHAIENRHRHAILHEIPNDLDIASVPLVMRNELCCVKDRCSSFLLQNVKEDILLITCGKSEHRDYAMKMVKSLFEALKQGIDGLKSMVGTQLLDFSKLLEKISSGIIIAENVLNVVSDCNVNGDFLLVHFENLADICQKINHEVKLMKLPLSRPRVVDLTDAGPGVGINNHEVYYRIAQEILLCDYDYYSRIHLAPGDSSMNEVERIQSSVGDAMADGGYIEWEHRKKFHGLSEDEVLSMTPKDLTDHEERRMKHNAFMVCDEIASRIDGNVAPNGYMKAYPSKKVENLFFWDNEYLCNFLKDIRCLVPGSNFYLKLKRYMELHSRVGEKYLEVVKCNDTDECDFCHPWVGDKLERIPQPFPDSSQTPKFKYKHFSATPLKIDGNDRKIDDFNPRVQLKKMYEAGNISLDNTEQISIFSKKYIVDLDLVESELSHIHKLHLAQVVRSEAKKQLREEEKNKNYEEFDWKMYVEEGKLKKLTVSTLDKYFLKHGLHQYLKLKKPQKIESITSHYYANKLENNYDSETDDEEESEDNVIALMSNEVCSEDDFTDQDSEDDSVENMDIGDSWENPAWFTTTRSGRVTGNPMLSSLRSRALVS